MMSLALDIRTGQQLQLYIIISGMMGKMASRKEEYHSNSDDDARHFNLPPRLNNGYRLNYVLWILTRWLFKPNLRYLCLLWDNSWLMGIRLDQVFCVDNVS